MYRQVHGVVTLKTITERTKIPSAVERDLKEWSRLHVYDREQQTPRGHHEKNKHIDDWKSMEKKKEKTKKRT